MDHDKFDLLKFEELVLKWSLDRKILYNSSREAQTLKAVSEMGELADAVAKGDILSVQDAIGDVMVCLVNVAALTGTDITTCAKYAWNQIKDRKGTMLTNGVFVKE